MNLHSDAFTKEGTYPGIQFPRGCWTRGRGKDRCRWCRGCGVESGPTRRSRLAWRTAAIASRAAAASFLPASGVVSQVLHTMAVADYIDRALYRAVQLPMSFSD